MIKKRTYRFLLIPILAIVFFVGAIILICQFPINGISTFALTGCSFAIIAAFVLLGIKVEISETQLIVRFPFLKTHCNGIKHCFLIPIHIEINEITKIAKGNNHFIIHFSDNKIVPIITIGMTSNKKLIKDIETLQDKVK